MVDRSGKVEERDSSNAHIRTLLEEQRQNNYRGISQEKSVITNSKQLMQRRLLREELLLRQQKMEFHEAHQRSFTEMEELRKFQSSTSDTKARRKLIEDQNTIMELSGRLQELQNEVNCMNDSKDFQEVESVRGGNSHVTSRPMSFPPHPILEGMLRHFFVSPSRKEGPPSIWDTHGFVGKRFCKFRCVIISSLNFVLNN